MMIFIRCAVVMAMFTVLTGCKDEYDIDEYKRLKSSGELEDVVHEWMHEYIERYCRFSAQGAIECE